MNPSLKSIFPKEFVLARQIPDYDYPISSSDSKSKKGKVRIVHPSVYMHDAPEGLAKALKKAASDDGEIYALGETEENCDCEFDILELHLSKDAIEDEAEEGEESMEDAIVEAAKKLGIKVGELGEEADDDEEDEEDEEDEKD